MNKYYLYWEDFVALWKCGNKPTGWTDPDVLPLYNTLGKKDYSSLYIPEPWWGNDGTQPLHSVVINFNPGTGGKCQIRQKFSSPLSYSKDVVGSPSILKKTRHWHQTRRAMRVLNSLYRLKCISQPYGLDNHLSVELVPWHTQSVNNDYINYLKQNIQAVYDNSICFAAEEARRIKNEILHGVVICRMNGGNTQLLLDELNRIGIKSSLTSPCTTASGNGKYVKFQISTLPDNKFVSIWGPKSRNDFPSNADMDEIFENI